MASLSGKYEMEIPIVCSPEKFWGGLKNSFELLPKASPKEVKSIEAVEGDGKSVGSVRKIVFHEGVPNATFVLEKITAIDDASKTLSYSVVDGDVKRIFKVFNPTFVVTSNGDGCLLKWSLEYEKLSEEPPTAQDVGEKAKKHFQEFGAYLHQN